MKMYILIRDTGPVGLAVLAAAARPRTGRFAMARTRPSVSPPARRRLRRSPDIFVNQTRRHVDGTCRFSFSGGLTDFVNRLLLLSVSKIGFQKSPEKWNAESGDRLDDPT